MHYRKTRWILSLIGLNNISPAGTCCTIVHTMIMASRAKLISRACPMNFNKLISVRHVAVANFAQIWCCSSEKVPAHTRECVAPTCPWNTSRQLYQKRANSAIWSLLHVPATQPCNMSRQCVLNAILSPLHFAATCSCNVSPRVGPPLLSQNVLRGAGAYFEFRSTGGDVLIQSWSLFKGGGGLIQRFTALIPSVSENLERDNDKYLR